MQTPATPYRLPSSSHVGKIRLAVSDLGKSLDFYTRIIGLRPLESTSPNFAQLSAQDSDAVLLELLQLPGLKPLGRNTRLGMYHFAVLLPTRGDLADFIRHTTEAGVPFGSADHLVSEATYLVDPDGLTIEVYADRPRQDWPFVNGQLRMASDPINAEGLMATESGHWSGAPNGTTIGHMHFYVGDLEDAAKFYQDGLGFEVMTHFPGALFMAAGGYHHHVGANVWAARSPIASEQDPRLLFWELVLPTLEDINEVSGRILGGRFVQDGSYEIQDPWGIQVALRSQAP